MSSELQFGLLIVLVPISVILLAVILQIAFDSRYYAFTLKNEEYKIHRKSGHIYIH